MILFCDFRSRAKSIAFLLGIVTVCRVIEMVTSQLNAVMAVDTDNADTISPFAFFDILIALQGVFIFIIFVCSSTPLWIIKRWWIASGSLDVAGLNTELSALKKDNV